LQTLPCGGAPPGSRGSEHYLGVFFPGSSRWRIEPAIKHDVTLSRQLGDSSFPGEKH
jgi:hypothetical protein